MASPTPPPPRPTTTGSTSSSTTRLDKLFTLLETGATPSLRLTAAHQIAALAAHHPVPALLRRLLPLLRSRVWATRTAAADAIERMARTVPWDPSAAVDVSVSANSHGTITDPVAAAALHAKLWTPLAAKFSPARIAELGSLAASARADDRSSSSSESAFATAAQRAMFLRKLGMDPADLTENGSDLLDGGRGGGSAPAASSTHGKSKTKSRRRTLSAGKLPPPALDALTNVSAATPTSPTTATTPVDEIDAIQEQLLDPALSTREKAVLRRKLKILQKSAPPPPLPTPKSTTSQVPTPPPKKVRKTTSNFDESVSIPPNPKRLRRDASNFSVLDDDTMDASSDMGSAGPPSTGGVAAANASPPPHPLLSSTGETVVISYKGPKKEPGVLLVDDDTDLDDAVSAKPPTHAFPEWPFQAFCDILVLDLVDPKWEVRHGAAMGLREVIKCQGAVAGTLGTIPADLNATLNRHFLLHLAYAILSVLVRDRFADYHGDTVKVPVRESASQALGVVVKHLTDSHDVHLVLQRLLQLLPSNTVADGSAANDPQPSAWSQHFAALLGIKYVLAVRSDMIQSLFPMAFPAVFVGLQSPDDDVKTVAAETLLPVTATAAELLNDMQLGALLAVLAASLDTGDDLSASTAAVMDMMAALADTPRVVGLIAPHPERHVGAVDPAFASIASFVALPVLVPRLAQHLRHPINSVRRAVLGTLCAFLRMDSERPPAPDRWWITPAFVRLLFQNYVIEDSSSSSNNSSDGNNDVLGMTDRLWADIAQYCATHGALSAVFGPGFSCMLALALTPIGQPLDARKLIFALPPSPGCANGGSNEPAPTDRAMISQDLAVLSYTSIVRGRLMATAALGATLARWVQCPAGFEAAVAEIGVALGKRWAWQRQLAATLVTEYALASSSSAVDSPESHAGIVGLMPGLEALAMGLAAPVMYGELQASLAQMYAECLGACRDVPGLVVPPLEAGFDAEFVLHAAIYRPHLGILLQNHQSLEKVLTTRVAAASAAALVALKRLPIKVGAVIRSLTNSLKLEDNLDVQIMSARALAQLALQRQGKPAVDKLVENMAVLVCSDPQLTPDLAAEPAVLDSNLVLTLVKLGETTLGGGNTAAAIDDAAVPLPIAATTAGRKRKREPAAAAANAADAAQAQLDTTSAAAAVASQIADADRPECIVHRGGSLFFKWLCTAFGAALITSVPSVGHVLALPPPPPPAPVATGTEADQPQPALEHMQRMVDAMQSVESLSKILHSSLHGYLLAQLPGTFALLEAPEAVLRYMAARSVAAMANVAPSPTMQAILATLLPKLRSHTSVVSRRGVIEAMHHLVAELGGHLLPYVVFLVVPLMGAMSDSDDAVRRLATRSFASMIQLIPLEEGIPDPDDFPPELVAARAAERQFIGQLLGTTKVANYEVPVAIRAELRRYQLDGINWMMFLNRYQLHGILCDDMGLGKTLQTITVLSSHHHDNPSDAPSLVVCPSTLVGHWQHEIEKYSPNLSAMIYAGVPAERRRMHGRLLSPAHNLVIITSYDVLRNDISVMAGIAFQYCVLDEGHIIRNAKTQGTRACKAVTARHRLILSGTPIQNNVLELWSLFDFLMPGFLGTEQAFNSRYAKLIQASRDAKKSSAEQQAGEKALKDLHRQVLPFVLRRLKEEVLDDLPPKIIQDYYCDLSPTQQKLYQAVVKSTQVGDKTHVFHALQSMRRICNHPLMYLDNPANAAAAAENAGVTVSAKKLHTLSEAPKLVALKQLLLDCGIGVQDEPSSSYSSTGGSAAALDDDGNEPVVAGHRVLVFAQMKKMLDLIESDLFKAHMPSVSYLRLDGSTEGRLRHGIVQKFNDDPTIDVLLLTTQAGGLGLNLTGADTVVFMDHDWNPMRDLQAMDRAHRLGQRRTVNVYRLIARGTLEEKIMGLQRFKLHIAGQVVNQQNAALESMDTDQLLDLFQASPSAGPSGSDTNATSAATGGGSANPGTGVRSDAAAILSGLDELVAREYEDEYNLDGYLASL
ncbi:SNF2 family N-terminal domain-containing protein [Blastocladiella britannica]|nr:SNF2 family N-terminal domain-containing protein [Blastocladiella britannica]